MNCSFFIAIHNKFQIFLRIGTRTPDAFVL